MVGIAIQCRLGNQFFQYAFIKALAEKLDTPYFLNDGLEKLIITDYFDLEGYHPLTNFLNRILFKIRKGHILNSLQSVQVGNYTDGIIDTLDNDTTYSGYCQSALFFQDIAPKIASYIKIKTTYKQKFEAKYKDKFSAQPVIAVHVRRGDYLNLNDWWAANMGSNDLTLPVSYYLNCINNIKGLDRYRIIFTSDDIEFCRSAFADLKNAEFEQNDMITDFQIMMNADICIISNSSFAWWAAYLNPKGNKLIFCPQYWLGFKIKKEYPENIIPKDWITINTR